MIIQTSVNIKDRGEVTLSLLPLDESEQCTKFALVETLDDKDAPYLSFDVDKEHIETDWGPKWPNVEESKDNAMAIINDICTQIFEAQRSNTLIEFDPTKDINDTKPYNPESIRIDTKNFSLRQIAELVADGDLNLKPEFQRNQVWNKKRKSRLIESILLRIPLPVFYFSEDEEGRYTVVDGLQRLSAICDFMNNKLKLDDLEYLENSCKGKTYNLEPKEKKIDEKFYRRFNAYQIAVNIISSDSPARVKYDIFKRLNTGGMPLNMQEIRNSFANQALRDLLKEMISLKSFKKATGDLTDARMQAREFALRYILFAEMMNKTGNVDSYSGIMDDELDNCVDTISSMKTFDKSFYLRSFDKAMENAYHLFGRHSFRKVKEGTCNSTNRLIINKLLFESWSVILSQYDSDVVTNKFEANSFIKILGHELDTDSEYYKYVSYGTNGRANVIYAFNKASEIMKTKMGNG